MTKSPMNIKNSDIPKAIQGARVTGNATTIGIGEMRISDNPSDVLVTYSLGSCIGVSLHDPELGIGGLIHCMLPLSRMSPEKARNRPCMFVDTGVSSLLQELFELGSRRQNIVARVAGGARMLDKNRTFCIGDRNYAVLRKIMWKNNILIDSHDLGGTVSRTMFFHVGTGVTAIKTGRSITLL